MKFSKRTVSAGVSINKIELDFKDSKELRKKFYRESVKRLSEYIISNKLCSIEKERNPYDGNEEILYSLKLFGLDIKDPIRFKIPSFEKKEE